MGEAIYYAKLRFSSKEKAEQQLETITNFLISVDKSYEDWQEHRSGGQEEYKDLFNRNRLVFEALGFLEDTRVDHHMNIFAGVLISPMSGSKNYWDTNHIYQIGDEVRFSGTVWHFADWDPLGKALIELTGAISFKWISDEYIDPFKLI